MTEQPENSKVELTPRLETENNSKPTNEVKNNPAKKSNTEEDGSKKVKKTSSLPKSHLAVSQLGQKVATSWTTHFANLNVPDTDARILAQDATDMLNLIRQSNESSSRKLQNTSELAAINTLINTATNALKAAIKLHNPTLKNLNAIYAAYGLETVSNSTKRLATDNSVRNEQMLKLIEALQTPNNAITNTLQPPFALRDWINLQQQHANLWAESENLRQLRSNNANEIGKLHDKINTQLKRIHQYMTGVYSREELARKKRLMGFLKESF